MIRFRIFPTGARHEREHVGQSSASGQVEDDYCAVAGDVSGAASAMIVRGEASYSS